MPKPTDIPVWATDVGAVSDPGPTRVKTGFVAGKKLPAKWLNWVLHRQAAWFTYLRDLHTEPEFLNKAYQWTGLHRFTQVLAASDLRWTTPPKRRILVDLLGAVDAATRFLPIPYEDGWMFIMGSTPEGAGLDSHTLFCHLPNRIVLVPFRLPAATRILEVNVCMRTGGGFAEVDVHMATGYPFPQDASPPVGPLAIAGRISPGVRTWAWAQEGRTFAFDMTKMEDGVTPLTVMGNPNVLYWVEIRSSDMTGIRPGGFVATERYDQVYWIELVVEEYGPARLG